MSDHRSLDVTPRAEFADALEAQLLRVLAGGRRSAASPTTPRPNEKESIMTLTTEAPSTARSTKPSPARWVIAAAAAVAVLVGTGYVIGHNGNNRALLQPPATNADPSAHAVSFRVVWTTSEIRHECPNDQNNGACINRFDMPASASFTGDVSGTAYQAVFWNDAVTYPGQNVDHLEHVIAYEVRGDVAGCGFGSFLMEETLQFVSGSNLDRPTGTYKGTWTIVPQSGRLGLATIAGSGTTSSIFGDANGRPFVGTVTCPAAP
jgi:hypothetical protein